MTTLDKLTAKVLDFEGILAPGSESVLLGQFVERMRQVTGAIPTGMPKEYEGIPVPDDEADWWIDMYRNQIELSRSKDMFGRIRRRDGLVQVFESSGLVATTIDADVYPVDSSVSARHEHPEGIVLTLEDAQRLGLEFDDVKCE